MIYIVIIIGVIIDLFSKNFAYQNFQQKISIFGDFLFFKYTENTGIAFSTQIPFLKYLTIILIIVIFYYYNKEEKIKKDKYIDISFGLILAGAIGNAFGRILNEKVIDFIGIKYFSIFNLADIFISIGALLYIFIIYKIKK